jgi:hypothetical protein
MALTETEKKQLFAGLEARAWTWREGYIYAPHESMWLSGEQPWQWDLREFHERMTGRLERNMQSREIYDHEAEHRNLVSDTQGLVDTLADMLSASEVEPDSATPRD